MLVSLETDTVRNRKSGSDWPRLRGMSKSVSKQRAGYFTPDTQSEI